MQRRAAAASGRPSGTDGSDFSYRMLVDSRYTKVAKGKSRLRHLIAAQAVIQVIGSMWVFSFASQDKGLGSFTILSVIAGFASLIIGELGRRRSRANLLRLYSIISSAATAFSVACVVRSDLFFKVIQYHNLAAFTSFEMIEATGVLLSIGLQVCVIVTTAALVQNMSAKRAVS